MLTLGIMGLATALVGALPTVSGPYSIGTGAGWLLLVMRVAQGLALGGEYGGAASTSSLLLTQQRTLLNTHHPAREDSSMSSCLLTNQHLFSSDYCHGWVDSLRSRASYHQECCWS
jgi:hypothetical protein